MAIGPNFRFALINLGRGGVVVVRPAHDSPGSLPRNYRRPSLECRNVAKGVPCRRWARRGRRCRAGVDKFGHLGAGVAYCGKGIRQNYNVRPAHSIRTTGGLPPWAPAKDCQKVVPRPCQQPSLRRLRLVAASCAALIAGLLAGNNSSEGVDDARCKANGFVIRTEANFITLVGSAVACGGGHASMRTFAPATGNKLLPASVRRSRRGTKPLEEIALARNDHTRALLELLRSRSRRAACAI